MEVLFDIQPEPLAERTLFGASQQRQRGFLPSRIPGLILCGPVHKGGARCGASATVDHPRLALVSEGPRKANRGIVGSRLTALAISPAPFKLSLPFPRAAGVIEAVEAVRPAALAKRRCRDEGSSERNQLRHLSQLGSARARMVTPARCRSSGAPWPPGSSLCHVARSGHFK
jgi:hypothetical protein